MQILRAVWLMILFLGVHGHVKAAIPQEQPARLENWLDRPLADTKSPCAFPVGLDSLPSVPLPPELDRVLRDYERLWKAGDAEGLADIFTADGFAIQRGRWVRGREAIVQAYGSAGGDLRLRALAHAADGDVGYIIGAYGYGDTPGAADRGKFILALNRSENGRWLIAADLDSGIPSP